MRYKRGQYQEYIGEKLPSRVGPLELLCVRWSESLEQVAPLHLLRYNIVITYLRYCFSSCRLILTI